MTKADGTVRRVESESISVRNPATGEIVANVLSTPEDTVAEIVAHAREAQAQWEALGFEGRARVLKRAQRWVLDHADEIVATIISETGKTYDDAHSTEVAYVASALGFWAKRAPRYLAERKVRSVSPIVIGRRLSVAYRPVGVVGVIGPWNYPLTNNFGDCIPALAAGNAVILKPSHLTPLTSLLMGRCMEESGLPESVYQVIVGGGSLGRALIDTADMIMFTGSTAIGKEVMARAAERLIPVSLELGGKDPMIVLADADIERAADSAVYGSMQNAGQTCISVERVYVEAPVYDRFVNAVTQKVSALRQGVSNNPAEFEVGAITTDQQLEIVERHVEQARSAGAQIPVGGERRNHFYSPTVLTDVTHDMLCMTEETFGPTLPIMRVKDAVEAIELANDSPYGLSASIWTSDLRRGERIAREIDAGAVDVNDVLINYSALELPMGGWKQSGFGRRHGPDGIRKYCRQQSLLISGRIRLPELHTFPYRQRKTRFLRWLLLFLYGRRNV